MSRRLDAYSPEGGSDEERSFLQDRVARFGLVAGGTSLLFFVYRTVHCLVLGQYSEFTKPPFPLHALALSCFFLVWFLCRRRPRTVRFVHIVEATGLIAGCIAYMAMGYLIPLVARPDLIMLLAMTIGLVARTVYVPSTVRRTAILGTTIGAPLIFTAYMVSVDLSPELMEAWIEAEPHMAANTGAFASVVAINTSVWWALTVLVCSAASNVLYGLRREIRHVRRLGRYTLEAKIGEGGMGEVYRASHAMLQRPTAIKLLRPEISSDRSILRFEREVQLTSQLTHPNTIAIYDYGRTPEGIFYYAMEYLDGFDLDQLVRCDGPQVAARVIHILDQICSSLAEAHERGLIHRDIKPSNVILCERGGVVDVAKVVDFGLVRDITTDSEATASGINVVTGTPLYMSPESIRTPHEVDARSDLYAVGAVGYFLVTGSQLFEGENVIEICSHHLSTRPTPPSERLGRSVSAELEATILWCLEKEPSERPRSAIELRDRLRRCGEADLWTEERAGAWWRTHKPDHDTKNRVETRTDLASTSTRTVDVDLDA